MGDKITIDRSTFKALAADTRIKILKLLDKRRHTQSELSADLKLSVPTVKEHLQALEKVNLVKKHEEGYKWKYYSLTEKAKCLLDPERKKVWVMLAFLFVSIAGTIIVFSRSMFLGAAKASFATQKVGAAEAAPEAMRSAEDSAFQTTVQTASQFPYALLTFAVLVIVFVVLLVYYLKKSRILRKH